jgi:hypothetical protein
VVFWAWVVAVDDVVEPHPLKIDRTITNTTINTTTLLNMFFPP